MAPHTNHTKKRNWLLVAVVLLFVLVFGSGIMVGIQVSRFTKQDKFTEITLQENVPAQNEDTPVAQAPQSSEKTETEKPQTSTQPTTGRDDGTAAAAPFVPKPGSAVDGGAVGVDIVLFRSSYNGDSGTIAVESTTGEKVVAPGVELSHKIRLRNTGNCALEYSITLSDLFSGAPEDRVVPIEVRVTDFNGKYILGDADTWIPLEDMDQVIHSGTVGRNSYVYYTLQWRWAFETGQDDYDTMLGNVHTEVVSCGIEVETYAQQHPNPDAIGGISNPFTGDTARLGLWTAAAMVSSFAIILLVVFFHKREKEEGVA